MQDLKGRVAVVTGGASGIGRALADAFAAAGARLVLADVETEALERAAEELRSAGAEVLAAPTDVADAEQMDALAARTLAELGAVHVVCNNAGVAGGGVMWELTTADWEFVLRVNLWGVIHGIRAFVPHLVAQNEGHVVNTASMAGLISVPGLGPYNASKHAVVTLSETLAGELANAGAQVGVSVLCPGFVNTRIFDSERNRPSELVNPGSELSAAERDERNRLAGEFMAQAMAPGAVAEQVLDAIRTGRFYILTHEGAEAAVAQRFEAIQARKAAAVPQPLVFGGE